MDDFLFLGLAMAAQGKDYLTGPGAATTRSGNASRGSSQLKEPPPAMPLRTGKTGLLGSPENWPVREAGRGL